MNLLALMSRPCAAVSNWYAREHLRPIPDLAAWRVILNHQGENA